VTTLDETIQRMRAEGYVVVEPCESFTFDVEGQPFRVEGPATISPKGIISFEHSGTHWIMDPKKFVAAEREAKAKAGIV
jgi:hypothetical protein